ncbi:DDE-type integrase/transposase/recombinase [Streptomyces sp. G5(2025)]|uniref:DDE-type integrase/transposase/recombinase n=1 Tax=Streptomyces sp. G5(2025) TaxID=3406628 RepID=UPI003C28C8F6
MLAAARPVRQAVRRVSCTPLCHRRRSRTPGTNAALQMAIAARGGQVNGVILHTDRGSEYTSEAFGQLCGRWGVAQPMGRVGSALDNAAAESFTPHRGTAEDHHVDRGLPQHETAPQRGRWETTPSSSNGSSSKRESRPIRRAGPHNQRLQETRGCTLPRLLVTCIS